MLQFPLVEVNKLSKVYHHSPSCEVKTFSNVESAQEHFLTKQAIEIFNQYCYNQEWKLVNDNKSLHWTISFELDTKPSDPEYIPNSDKWRDAKERMTESDWFLQEHSPNIDHDVEHLF